MNNRIICDGWFQGYCWECAGIRKVVCGRTGCSMEVGRKDGLMAVGNDSFLSKAVEQCGNGCGAQESHGCSNGRQETRRNIPEPSFVADPNHRRKLLMKELYALANAVVAKRKTMTTIDATRIEKNFAYCIPQLPKKPESKYVHAGQAVLNHHFDCHDYCGAWCKRKRQSEAQRNLPQNKQYYRCKTKDTELYEHIVPIVERFVRFDRLKEVAHGMDTQVNESFNNTFSWLAPKNKVYAGTQSLRNRLSIAIGINALGQVDYFTRLFKKLGIVMTPNVHHFLEMKETRRAKRLQKVKEQETKKMLRKVKNKKQRRDELVATRERDNRDAAVYKTGQNMQDDVADEGNNDGTTKKKSSTRSCPFCGKKGHTTRRSKHCRKNPANIEASATANATGTAACCRHS
jgi:hypothetical protein